MNRRQFLYHSTASHKHRLVEVVPEAHDNGFCIYLDKKPAFGKKVYDIEGVNQKLALFKRRGVFREVLSDVVV